MLQLQVLLPKASAMELPDLVIWADIIVLAVPLQAYRTLPLMQMKGKIVIDAMNYWAPVDGKLPEFDAYAGSSSERVAETIPGARLVKTLNSVAYNELEEHALPPGSPDRRAIALAGDDAAAKQTVAELIDAIGFDPVDLGGLAKGRLFEPDTQLFNHRLTKKDIAAIAHV